MKERSGREPTLLTRSNFLQMKKGLIIHDPVRRGANGAAIPTDEDDQDGNFFFNHPEREGYFAA